MLFNMGEIKNNYEKKRGLREVGKYFFSVATFGLGGLYLWATTTVIKDGEIGLRRTASGKMILLPPGRHSNFPWEDYPVEPQSLSKKQIILGPYKIITVDTGCVAKTNNKGKLEILGVGQHLICDASHTFEEFISTKEETKKLHKVTASTSDNVGLTLYADVRYQIEKPEDAVAKIHDIEESIKQIAEMSISQIVSHHSLNDFAPAISTTNFSDPQSTTIANATIIPRDSQNYGIGSVVRELGKVIAEQLSKLGIKLINIGITSWHINDTNLAHELAQGAVIKSQTQSRLLAAQNAASVKRIETEAETQAIVQRAKAEAEAVKTEGEAYFDVAARMKSDPVALGVYELAQRTKMVSHARNANLFFNASSAPQPAVVATLPLSAPSV